jgi:hypothetical protein
MINQYIKEHNISYSTKMSQKKRKGRPEQILVKLKPYKNSISHQTIMEHPKMKRKIYTL